ncbi:hypothetical protein X425_01497 [Mycobacterium avium XTB13-223]|nr:hypothetical protein X425_01497 [Mycobacterium avium XTB13-223]
MARAEHIWLYQPSCAPTLISLILIRSAAAPCGCSPLDRDHLAARADKSNPTAPRSRHRVPHKSVDFGGLRALLPCRKVDQIQVPPTGASSPISNSATGTVGSTSHNTSISADLRARRTSSAWISALGNCQCHRPHSVTARSDQSSASSATRYATSRAASSTNSRRSRSSQLAGSRKCRSNTRATSEVGTKSSSMLPLCPGRTLFVREHALRRQRYPCIIFARELFPWLW